MRIAVMQPLPHLYSVAANSPVSGALTLNAAGVPPMLSAAPLEFDGPGDQWSPELLLVAAVASCFILTFRAVARASRLEWTQLECKVEGTLERIEGVTQFSNVVTRAKLTVPAGGAVADCIRILEKAEHGCLVANSLRSKRELKVEVVQVP
jgi:organic hydroperoxide reductase OsmC/OhrA